MKKQLIDLLKSTPVILDGAWGTQLQAQGLESGVCPDYWNLIHPDNVESVARSYILAGSRVILTNTFRANRSALSGYNLQDHADEINRAGVAISRRAAKDGWVMASIGPSGKMLMMGEITEEELSEDFTHQAVSLAEAGADGIVIETMTDLNEALIALHAALTTGLPVAVSMVFDSGPHKTHTMMGNSLFECVVALEKNGADIIGANCGTEIDDYISVCHTMSNLTRLPIWMKPNAGLPQIIDGKIIYSMTPENFALKSKQLYQAGASLVGGCCGTSPDFIREIVKLFSAS